MLDATASSDMAWYIFSDADIAQRTTSKLIAAPLQGGTFVQLSADSEQASKPLISPRNDRVLYASTSSDIACPETNLVSVPIAGGESRRLSAQCGTGGSVTQFLWSSSGAQAVYLVTYQDAQGKSAGFELFSSDGQAILPTPSPDASGVWLPLVQHAVLQPFDGGLTPPDGLREPQRGFGKSGVNSPTYAHNSAGQSDRSSLSELITRHGRLAEQ
jgi:hypothetical protein